jgi:hypothetical protein
MWRLLMNASQWRLSRIEIACLVFESLGLAPLRFLLAKRCRYAPCAPGHSTPFSSYCIRPLCGHGVYTPHPSPSGCGQLMRLPHPLPMHPHKTNEIKKATTWIHGPGLYCAAAPRRPHPAIAALVPSADGMGLACACHGGPKTTTHATTSPTSLAPEEAIVAATSYSPSHDRSQITADSPAIPAEKRWKQHANPAAERVEACSCAGDLQRDHGVTQARC